MACMFAASMRQAGRTIRHQHFFDTVVIEAPEDSQKLIEAAASQNINLRHTDGAIIASFDETSTLDMLDRLVGVLGGSLHEDGKSALPERWQETQILCSSLFFTNTAQKQK